MLRAIVSSLEASLLSQGLVRAEKNFNFESIPATAENYSFTLGDLSVLPQYHPGQRVLYNKIELTLLVLCHVYGPHNPSAKASNGYLASLDIFEIVENLVVNQQKAENGENLTISSATLQPLQAGRNDEYLIWRIRLQAESNRSME